MNNSLAQHFAYEMTDKKAKANLIKSAGREAFIIDEKQKCSMLLFSTGSYIKTVIPAVRDWNNYSKEGLVKDDLEISVDEVLPAYDKNNKHMETSIRFC